MYLMLYDPARFWSSSRKIPKYYPIELSMMIEMSYVYTAQNSGNQLHMLIEHLTFA